MNVGIIGIGYVGSSVAVSLLHSGVVNRLLINDIDADRAVGEMMDLSHGAPFYPSCTIDVAAIADLRACDAVVICAGRGGSADESRLQLLADNIAVARDIGRQLAGFAGITIVVSNPVDILTKIVTDASGLPPSRVLGTGTMLDTARLRHKVGRELGLDSRSIHAHVVGEHGDSEVPLWSSATIGGRPLRMWSKWNPEVEGRVAEQVRTAAYEIIRRKGATNHAIGLVTAALLRWLLRGEHRALTLSMVQDGAMGIEGVALSLPTVVGVNGAVEVIEPIMNDRERAALLNSAQVLRAAAAEAEAAATRPRA
jgi:L-lactate dehydrogenase